MTEAKRKANGISDFAKLAFAGHPEWSLFAIRAPKASVAAAFYDRRKVSRWERNVPLEPSAAYEPMARLVAVVRIARSRWTVVYRSMYDVSGRELKGVPQEARVLSAQFKTKAITFFAEDTSGTIAYGLYDQGSLIEQAEWEIDRDFWVFTSKIRRRPEGSEFGLDFADDVFGKLGIYLPACYPRSDGSRFWLAVCPPSMQRVSGADILELKEKYVPTRDRLPARLRRKLDKAAASGLGSESGVV
jgi:hypothetical protein